MTYDRTVARRRWGAGSVYRRKDGRWVASLRTESGRRSWYAKTRAEARALLEAALEDRSVGVVAPPAGLTVADYLRRWLDEFAPLDARASTIVGYRAMMEGRIIPAIGGLPLSRLSTLDIQRYLNAMRAAGRSPYTVKHHLSFLRVALGRAVKLHFLRENPATEAKAPRTPRSERPTLDVNGARQFLAHVAGGPHEALYALALTTGMRQAEILGLAWDDVDLDRGMLTVRYQLDGNRKVGWNRVPPKTDEIGSITLTPLAIAALRTHRQRQLEARMAARRQWPYFGLVFVTPGGNPMAGTTVRTRFQRDLVAAGLPLMVDGKRFHFHDLRHSTATILLGLGVPARIVADLMRHSTTKVTTDTYQHVTAAMTAAAAEAMQRAIGE